MGLNRYILLTIMALVLFGCSSTSSFYAPMYYETKKGAMDIPNGHKSYTLFIATSKLYIDKISKSESKKIKKYFRSFGENIGKDNLAVWVNNPATKSLDISRGKTYLDNFCYTYNKNYEYSNGPYLLYYTYNPDEKPKQGDMAILISFASTQVESIVKSFEHIEAQIRRKKVNEIEIRKYEFWKKTFDYASNVDKEFIKDIAIGVLGALK